MYYWNVFSGHSHTVTNHFQERKRPTSLGRYYFTVMEDISISGQKYLLPIIFVTLFCNDAIYWKSNTCSTILTKLLGVYVFLPRCINIFYPTYRYTSKPAKCVTGSGNNLQWRSDIFNLQMIKKWTHPTFTLVFLY